MQAGTVHHASHMTSALSTTLLLLLFITLLLMDGAFSSFCSCGRYKVFVSPNTQGVACSHGCKAGAHVDPVCLRSWLTNPMTNHLLHWCQKDFSSGAWHLELHPPRTATCCISCLSGLSQLHLLIGPSLVVDRVRLHFEHEMLRHVCPLLAAAWCRVCL